MPHIRSNLGQPRRHPQFLTRRSIFFRGDTVDHFQAIELHNCFQNMTLPKEFSSRYQFSIDKFIQERVLQCITCLGL